MNNPYKLNYKELKPFYNQRKFRFRTTEDLEINYDIIGQERAAKAMEFGLSVNNPKYNMYICGLKGTGKTSYTIAKVREKAKNNEPAEDWCYVHNFKIPEKPKLINLPAGMGKKLQDDMENLILEIKKCISQAFISEDYEKNKREILNNYKEEQNLLIETLDEYSNEMGFEVDNTSTGLVFVPIKDGEKLDDEAFDMLNDEEKIIYEENADKIQSKALVILKKLKAIEKEANKELNAFHKNTGQDVIQPIFENLFNKYKKIDKVVEYLKDVEDDVINNILAFENLLEDEQSTNISLKSFAPKYFINLIVDNSNTKGAPVVVECNPTYNNLLGLTEYKNENGTLKTDFTMIKSGSLQRSNGGYLIIQAEELLRNEYSWQTLKRVLATGEIKMESLRQQLGITDIATLSPESIPLKIKLILIGSQTIFNLLSIYDEDFDKLFKIKVDFDSIMENNFENQMAIAQFVSSFCSKEGLKPFDKSGVIKIIEFSNRIAGSQNKLSTRFNKITEILIEADAWAETQQSKLIDYNHVEMAINEKRFRHNRVEEAIDEMYKDGKIVIEVENRRVGKINGLSVIDVGDHIFGKPSVITVSTYAGNKGVINIEREADMSGSIHDKGVMILEGFLNELFCKEEPLNITAKICFEQSYSGIDGDSASSTELYGVLSSIGNIPIRQDIAVTGSINQKGEIQPVGGITEKIEGFYQICKYLGLNGKQGVIIPIQNVDELVLCDEVIEAVRDGYFNIYPITNIEEGLEILTDKSFEEIVYRVKERLKEYSRNSKEEINK